MPHLICVAPVTGYGEAETARRLDLMRAYLRPHFTLEMRVPGDGPRTLEQPGDFERAHRAALAAVGAIAPETCGAIIASGAVDPGLPALRAAARVPVIGPGEASLYVASLLGSRLAIVTVEAAAPAAHEMIARVRARPETVTVHAMPISVRKILASFEDARKVIYESAEAAVRDDKADVIYLGSMTQGSLGIARDLRRQLGVPVIDPLPVAVHAAEEAAAALES